MPRLSISLDITSSTRAILYGSTAAYVAGGKFPELVLDFDDSYFRTESGQKDFSDVVTHTRASTATYVDSNGVLQTAGVNVPRVGHHVYNGSAWVNEGVLHESEARTNLFSYNKFDDAALQSTSQMLGATVQIGGSGSGVTAEVVAVGVESGIPYFDWDFSGTNSGGGTLFIFVRDFAPIATVDGDTYTVSANLKLISGSVTENNNLQFYCHFRDAGSALIDAPAFALGASITSQWQKFHAALTGTGASISQIVDKGIYLRVPAGDAVNFRVRIGGMQVEKAPTPSSYIPTAGSTVTRAADVMTIPAANLPWPTPEYIGPELVTNGTFDTDISGWTAAFGSISWSDGKLLLTEDGADGSSARAYQIITTEVGKVYRITADVGAVSLGNVVIAASNSVATGGKPQVVASQNTSAELVFVAETTATYIVLSVQGTTARTAELDNISVREINPLAVSIQMDGRVTYADTDIFEQFIFNEWYGDSNNEISFRVDTFGAATGTLIARYRVSGSDIYPSISNEFLPDIGVPYNVAYRATSTSVQLASGGTTSGVTSVTSLPDIENGTLYLGHTKYMGTIRTFRIWADDIGDAGLVEATLPSLVPSLSLTFDGTENSFIVEDWSE